MYIAMVHSIDDICDLSWPLMASKTEKLHVLVLFTLNSSNFTLDMDYTLLQDLKKFIV